MKNPLTRLARFDPNKLRKTEIGLAALLAVILIAQLWWSHHNRLPDMTAYTEVAERKAAFFNYLTPIIESRNQTILEERTDLLAILRDLEAGKDPSFLQKLKLESLAKQYRVDWDPENITELAYDLEQRIDSVPVSLVIVQAAKESGWGTSKFAREANNLFGEWCFEAGCGIVPAKRPANARHEVRSFDSVSDSVTGYMHNINTGRAYDMLRELRAQSRLGGTTADGLKLADGLIFYSQRRQAYIDEVKTMIRQYHAFQADERG